MTHNLPDDADWQEIGEKPYTTALEVLPPAIQTSVGFLMGEPMHHRPCKATGYTRAAYIAYAHLNGKYFICSKALTVPEFRNVLVHHILRPYFKSGN